MCSRTRSEGKVRFQSADCRKMIDVSHDIVVLSVVPLPGTCLPSPYTNFVLAVLALHQFFLRILVVLAVLWAVYRKQESAFRLPTGMCLPYRNDLPLVPLLPTGICLPSPYRRNPPSLYRCLPSPYRNLPSVSLQEPVFRLPTPILLGNSRRPRRTLGRRCTATPHAWCRSAKRPVAQAVGVVRNDQLRKPLV